MKDSIDPPFEEMKEYEHEGDDLEKILEEPLSIIGRNEWKQRCLIANDEQFQLIMLSGLFRG